MIINEQGNSAAPVNMTYAAGYPDLGGLYQSLDEKGWQDRKKAVSDYARRYGPAEFTEEVLKVYERAKYKNDHSDKKNQKNKWPAHFPNPFFGNRFLK